jgi:hypothetical protein
MKKSTVIKLLSFLALLAGTGAQAQVINFHNATQGTIPGYNQLYYGQGAYSDFGNNVWNGFSAATYAGGGPGSTLFYGNNNHYPASGGNPGNPYAAYGSHGTITGVGAVLFGTGGTIDGSGNPTTVPAGNATSHGLLSPVTLSMNYGFDNGATAGSTPGTPSWLLTAAAVVNGANPGVGTTANPLGSFTLHNLASGSYNLFLYGQNYDANRGAAFSLNAVNGGTALGGLTMTLNTGNRSTFVLGDNYVEFLNVHPDVNGDISGFWGAVSNPLTGFSGEGDFNGLQLVAVPEPSVMALFGIGLFGLLASRRRK